MADHYIDRARVELRESRQRNVNAVTPYLQTSVEYARRSENVGCLSAGRLQGAAGRGQTVTMSEDSYLRA